MDETVKRIRHQHLLQLLEEYLLEQSMTCEYECCNCDLGATRRGDSVESCSLSALIEKLHEELYEPRM